MIRSFTFPQVNVNAVGLLDPLQFLPHPLQFVFKSVAFLGKVEILVSCMTSLETGKVVTVVDSMITAKRNYSPGFKFQIITIPSYCPLKPITK